MIEVTPLLFALKQLRSIERDAKGSTITLTCYEAGAVLDALDLLRRVRDSENGADQTGIEIDSETWTLLCEAAEAVENSR